MRRGRAHAERSEDGLLRLAACPVVCPRFSSCSLSLVSAEAGALTGRVLDPAAGPCQGPPSSLTARWACARRPPTPKAASSFARPGRRQLPASWSSPRICRAGPDRPPGADTAPLTTCNCASRRVAKPSSSSAAPVPRPLSESPADHDGGRAEDVKARQLENVADALRTTPGLRRGPQRRPRRADIGLPSRRRVGLHARAGRRHPRQQLRRRVRLQPAAVGDVEQVEIVRGPQSAVFGADAIGGVVHLTTRQGGRADRVGGNRRRRTGDAAGHGRRHAATVGPWSFGGGGERTRAMASPASRRPPARQCPTTTGERQPRAENVELDERAR